MTELVKKADKFVLNLFKEKLPNTYIFHNYSHTKRVAKSTKELIENSEINVKEQEILMLSAWLHDTGYTEKFEGHEEESVKIATKFLEENNADQETIDGVTKCILATRMNTTPETTLEKIIRDADSSHLAKEYFEDTSELLRQELQLLNIRNFSAGEWTAENVHMFTELERR